MILKKNIGNRRDFLHNLMRWFIIFGFVGMAIMFWRRSKQHQESVCINNSLCKGCRVLDNCDRPEAKSYKVSDIHKDTFQRGDRNGR
jgi:hypothetical protein